VPFSLFCVRIHAHLLSQSPVESSRTNMFDDLPALAAPKPSDLRDELESYLSSDPEHVADVLLWWFERQHMYPALSCMAVDYLTIPGMYQVH
jgi:hypothetical protein